MAYTQARELDDGRIVSLLRPFASESFGGALAIIDAEGYASADQPTWDNQGAGDILRFDPCSHW